MIETILKSTFWIFEVPFTEIQVLLGIFFNYVKTKSIGILEKKSITFEIENSVEDTHVYSFYDKGETEM